jgi:serine phosphatase RsbU (regulator of sigma subunit)
LTKKIIYWNLQELIDSIGTIYLFTDGFPDQFGGDFGKKFLCKRFKNMIAMSHSQSMNDQKEILENTLNEWKRNEEQTDDICVLGIRF